jgi:hypothetical protein
VGDRYYLVTSTCEYGPGLPVLESEDLATWRQIGNVVTRTSQVPLTHARSSLGLFAPTIRFHEGIFYVVSTLVGRGHFVVTATDPAGPWSDPLWLDGEGWDPSLVFDGDETHLLYSTGHAVFCYPFDRRTGLALGPHVELWAGTGGDAPEGPHLYRHDGYWFLVIAEGGTSAGHAVTVARSTELYGPYEGSPGNPVLTHRGLSSPFQAIGHADLVDTPDGRWYAVVLGSRPVGGHGYQLLGRETFLVSVEWEDDGSGPWPRFGDGGRVPVSSGIPGEPPTLAFDDPLTAPPGLGWLSVRTAEPGFVTTGPAGLGLTARATTLDDTEEVPAFLGRRQDSHRYVASVRVAPDAHVEGGIALRRDERHHYEMLSDSEGTVRVAARIGDLRQVVAQTATGGAPLELRVCAVPRPNSPVEGSGVYEFSYRDVGTGEEPGPWIRISHLESRYLSTEVAAGFTGVVAGMYAVATGDTGGTAWFSRWHSGATDTTTKEGGTP